MRRPYAAGTTPGERIASFSSVFPTARPRRATIARCRPRKRNTRRTPGGAPRRLSVDPRARRTWRAALGAIAYSRQRTPGAVPVHVPASAGHRRPLSLHAQPHRPLLHRRIGLRRRDRHSLKDRYGGRTDQFLLPAQHHPDQTPLRPCSENHPPVSSAPLASRLASVRAGRVASNPRSSSWPPSAPRSRRLCSPTARSGTGTAIAVPGRVSTTGSPPPNLSAAAGSRGQGVRSG